MAPPALPLADPAPADGALPQGLTASSAGFGAYIHIPFCRVRCGYCDFVTYTASEIRGVRREDYPDAVAAEVVFARQVLADAGVLRPAATVFFGGGTPTLLPPGALAGMLDRLRDELGVSDTAEITVEANPDTVTDRVAAQLAAAGVTRMSIGMQSAVPEVLAALDRTHRQGAVESAVAAARAAGLAVSVDLIYGAPGETLDQWQQSVDAALALPIDHLSAYALVVEEGTPLARRIRSGALAAPDPDLQADMYDLVDEAAAAHGLEWYEISNWARGPAARSRHNLGYWRGADWWGFGPGAHSHVDGVRWWNVKHPAVYAQRLAHGFSPAAGRETLGEAARRMERVLLRTRLAEGLPVVDLTPPARTAVARLVADGLVEGPAAVAGTVVPTRRGRLLADVIARALTADVAPGRSTAASR